MVGCASTVGAVNRGDIYCSCSFVLNELFLYGDSD